MSNALPPRLSVKCPTCKGDSIYGADNPFRPFCSERCKSIDFGGWASESYRLKATPPREDDEPDTTPPLN